MRAVQTKLFEYGQEEITYLKCADAQLGAAIERLGRVERTVMPDLFTALLYAIVGQLISAKAVHTIWNRMQVQFGELTPQQLAMRSAEEIQKCGMTMKKAICIQQIAATLAQGDFQLDDLHGLSDTEVVNKLMKLKGVGKWTAEMMLIHALERRDVVSWGDIAIRRGMMKLYGLSTLTHEQFEVFRRRYSPYGSVASIYLWHLSFE